VKLRDVVHAVKAMGNITMVHLEGELVGE